MSDPFSIAFDPFADDFDDKGVPVIRGENVDPTRSDDSAASIEFIAM